MVLFLFHSIETNFNIAYWKWNEFHAAWLRFTIFIIDKLYTHIEKYSYKHTIGSKYKDTNESVMNAHIFCSGSVM